MVPTKENDACQNNRSEDGYMKSDEARKRAKELVAQMTLGEKMSQMLNESPAIERLGIPCLLYTSRCV